MNRKTFRKYNILKAHQCDCTILPNGELRGLDSFSTRVNNNAAILGASGAGKTRSVVIPNILSACGSYIVADPKGSLYKNYSENMLEYGYKVLHIDLLHPEASDKYNPLEYVHTSDDALKLASQLVRLGYDGKSATNDPFWEKAAEMLASALIGYIAEGGTAVEHSVHGITELLSKIDPNAYENDKRSPIDGIFLDHKIKYQARTGKESWAYEQFQKFKFNASKTLSSIIITLQTMIGTFDTAGIRKMTSGDNTIDIRSIGTEKTIVFISISDTDRSKDVIANIFYSQAINELCTFADEEFENSCLPVNVRFILDDFGTNCRIHGFENMISNIRSRGISATLILQSESQLAKGYGDSSHTILDNCDTIVYMGGNDIETARIIAERSNSSVPSVLNMPVGTNWVFRRGEKPVFSNTVDLSEYYISPKRYAISR